ncbi:MAG: hypothetical protein ACRERU_07525, partial [Methylococcales bacterium]
QQLIISLHKFDGRPLFSHITRACHGVVFQLKVTVDILTGVYATRKKGAANFLETMKIVFDDYLPRWNYRALPQQI